MMSKLKGLDRKAAKIRDIFAHGKSNQSERFKRNVSSASFEQLY